MNPYRATIVRSFALCSALILPLAALGQNGTSTASSELKRPVGFVSQHLKFLSADGFTRYRYVDKGSGKCTDRDEQYKVSTRVQLDLVGEGVTYIQGRGESGRSFTSSYDYTGMGLNKRYWSFNLKSLLVGQKIGKYFDVQAGGLEYEWGAGSEATYADNDGWLTGYRLHVSPMRSRWLPEKLSVSVGYVGDFTQPNVFAHMHRMGEENYVQVLAVKKLGKNRDVSAEFDSIQTIRYTREALRWQKLPLIVVDEFSAEAITRASDNPSFGWFSSLSRTLDKKKRAKLGYFYSDIPAGMFLRGKTTIFQNGDCYALGKRTGPTVRVVPFNNFELTLFGSDRLDRTPGPRYRGQVQVRYQFASLLNRALQ